MYQVGINKGIILICTAYQISRLTPLDFCLWGWMKGEVYIRNVDTQDELLARILGTTASIKTYEDQFRRTTRDLRIRVTERTEVEVGICEHSL